MLRWFCARGYFKKTCEDVGPSSQGQARPPGFIHIHLVLTVLVFWNFQVPLVPRLPAWPGRDCYSLPGLGPWICLKGFIRHRPPASHPGIRLDLRTRRPPTGALRALRARSAPGSVRECVSKNRGVPESVWRSALGALLKVTQKCQRIPGALPQTLPGTPRFSGTLSRALRGGLRARRARRLL